ncbi:hypothetical protein SSTU70S_02066 [Stutzerimonas stutzeri]
MIAGRAHNGWVIWLSLLVALLLSIAPMPASTELARPLWLGLVIAFWSLALPHRGGMGLARLWPDAGLLPHDCRTDTACR